MKFESEKKKKIQEFTKVILDLCCRRLQAALAATSIALSELTAVELHCG